MSGRKKDPKIPVSFRLSAWRVRQIDAAAEAAGLDRTSYLLWRLRGLEPPAYPALAALARIIAIHEVVAADPASAPDVVAELGRLILELSPQAHRETDR